MPIHIYWDDESQRIIRWEHEGQFTIEEFWDAQIRLTALDQTVPYKVDVIINSSHSLAMPKGLFSAMMASNTRMNNPSVGKNGSMYNGLVVMVSSTTVLEMLIQMVQRVLGAKRWRAAASVEKARSMIYEYREQN
jgi:hypothetical protein